VIRVKRFAARVLRRFTGRGPEPWSASPEKVAVEQPLAPADREGRWDLAICAIFKDEAEYLREWIEFHRIVGVEKFVLFDHGSTDGSAELLAPYVEAGIVSVYAWPIVGSPQPRAYEKCLTLYRDRIRWLAFIDIDEFLYPVADEPLLDCLERYAEHPALAVNWIMFATSGYILRPEGLVTEHFRACDPAGHKMVKCVVQPSRTVSFAIHNGEYVDAAVAVNEAGVPTAGGTSRPPSVAVVRVNHYWTRSVEEFLLRKAKKGSAHAPPGGVYIDARGLINAEREWGIGTDDVIQRYVPELRRRLDQTAR
jgi:hypothetical protein